MRAAKLTAPGRIEVQEVPFIPNPGKGEVVVQVKAVGICGTDLHIFQGHRADVVLPRIMGHELSGFVTHTGEGVTEFAPGDRVILDPVFACWDCPACKAGHTNVCAKVACFGVQMEGGFQDYITVPAHRLFQFPATVSMEQAALAEPFSIAANITARIGMHATERAVVIGAGTIGLVLVQTLVGAGVDVLISDVVDSKLEVAKSFGAKHIVNSKKENLAAAVDAFSPGGAEIVIDAVGITPLTQQSLEYAAPAARVTIIGFDDKPLSIPPVQVTKKELMLIGSRMNNGRFPTVVGWLEAGSIDPQPMITGVYPLERIQEAFDYILAHAEQCIKTLITL